LDRQLVTFPFDNGTLAVGLEIPDVAQVTVCNRLTNVDQPFNIHLIQSLL